MESTSSRNDTSASPVDQQRRVAEAVGHEVELCSIGGASRTFALTGTDEIVTLPRSWPEQPEPVDELVRRATLQQRIARRVRVSVPQVVRILPEHGIVVVRRLAGERLVNGSPALRDAMRPHVATVVGGLLGDLHTWEPAAYEDLARDDGFTPEDWRAETAGVADDLKDFFDSAQHQAVSRFLAEPAPALAPTRVLSHNDLGIEHILVSTAVGTPTVAGVIDWDDAAICDPAYDFGLLLRDLGPHVLGTALSAYADAGGDADQIPERAYFYSRCKLLEDLSFGITDNRPEYVAKSLAGWAENFG